MSRSPLSCAVQKKLQGENRIVTWNDHGTDDIDDTDDIHDDVAAHFVKRVASKAEKVFGQRLSMAILHTEIIRHHQTQRDETRRHGLPVLGISTEPRHRRHQQNILIITVEEMLTDGLWGRDEKYVSWYNVQ